MMTGSQRWEHGDWMLKSIADTKRKQRRQQRAPMPTDIFRYGIRTNKEGDVQVCSRNNGRAIFEVESYDEAQRLLNEEYGLGA